MPKAVWRSPSPRRTLSPLILEPLVETALNVSPSEQTSTHLIESEVTSDGSEVKTRLSRELKNDDSAGVFELAATAETVRLRLSQEACRRELYTPPLSSPFLAALLPSTPTRAVLIVQPTATSPLHH